MGSTISWSDVIMYVYTIGAIFSGVFVERFTNSLGPVALMGSGLLIAAFWVGYYNDSIVPRFESI